jgi:aryl-alcohol dehydrogenase-like predicted oxidoreductase
MLDPAASYVITKIGICRDEESACKRFDRDALSAAFDASQERLDRDKLDVVLLHCPTVGVLEAGDCATTMRHFIEEGKLSHWGVRAGSPEVAQAAVDAGAEVVELAYNLMIAADLHDVADGIAATETALLVRSVLAHGLLAGYWRPDRSFPSFDHRATRWDEAQLRYRVEQLAAFRPLLGEEVPTLRALAVRFALANHLVTSAVLGPRTLLQLEQLIRELGDASLSAEILEELPLRLAAVGLAS